MELILTVGATETSCWSLSMSEPPACPWISGPQFNAWKHTQLVIDVLPGRGGGFRMARRAANPNRGRTALS